MGKRFDTLLFPGGFKKAFTLSYDDGVIQDKRLLELFEKYNVKGTFNIGYGVLGYKPEGPGPFSISKVEIEEVKELYKDQEVGGHSLYHSDLTSLGEPYMMYEILEDKQKLESLVEKPLQMFAYPFGLFNKNVKRVLKSAGYKGARTIRTTHRFDLPDDPFEIDPTCHHGDEKLMSLAGDFINSASLRPQLFFVWGHAYEFDKDDNWDVMDEFLAYMDANRQDIWFATNGELLSYLEAYKRLEYSVDGSMIYNPTCTDVEIVTSFTTKEVLKAGEITRIQDTLL
ncbi:MAG: polysaccharide deacetylase family protein [Erysipelotrichaceae bacterium]|nr:polysaccharide deacetylase family protein [Erysipelotrichaceae bacterium]